VRLPTTTTLLTYIAPSFPAARRLQDTSVDGS
jgi:hypothetical protein